MARKKKNGNQSKALKRIAMVTAILNLIIKLIELLDTLLEKLLD